MSDAIASPEMGEASPLVYNKTRGKIATQNWTVQIKDLEQFNVMAVDFIQEYPRAQEEPMVEVQTWGYGDEDSQLLFLLFRCHIGISDALAYCDATQLSLTINRYTYSQHKEYFQDRTLRLVTEPTLSELGDELQIPTGRKFINEYLKKGFLQFPDSHSESLLQESKSFAQCVVLAISEVETQWTGEPKIGEINTPVAELPIVAAPPTFRQRAFVFCMYGGGFVWAGAPARVLLVPLTAPLGHTWIYRTILIHLSQYGYQLWKRYRFNQWERRIFQVETQLIHDEAELALERNRLRNEQDSRPFGDKEKEQHEMNAKSNEIFRRRKELELIRRNFYIQHQHQLSRKRKRAISNMVNGGMMR